MVGVSSTPSERALGAMRTLLDRGYLVLTGGPAGDVLTLTPPLTIEMRELEDFATCLQASC